MRWLLVLLLLFGAAPVLAHDGLPVVVAIEQRGNDLYLGRLTVPPSVPAYAAPTLHLTAPCTQSSRGGLASVLYRCSKGLGASEVRLDYPAGKPAVPTLVRIAWLSGESRSLLAPAGQSRIALPSPESATRVVRDYFDLGVEHILGGWDHLAFLLCLLVIAGTPRRMFWTVTGFTAGHAVTLSCAALGIASLPRAAVEAAIALSIMIVAGEIWRSDRTTLTWRHPMLVSSVFGLLHGFGFASALTEMGLPQTELPLALLAFNLGIEAGQLAFVLACALLWWLLARLPRRSWPGWAAPGTALALATGSIAGFWFVDRTLAIIFA